MQGLLAVVEEGLMMVSKQPNQDPATQLGLFLVNYQKPWKMIKNLTVYNKIDIKF